MPTWAIIWLLIVTFLALVKSSPSTDKIEEKLDDILEKIEEALD